MKEFIARTLVLNSEAGRQTVAVSIFLPVAAEASWECLWQIVWPDRERKNLGLGVDGVQALVHALQMIASELYASEEHRSGQLIWTEGYNGYGFPAPAQIRELLLRDDARFL